MPGNSAMFVIALVSVIMTRAANAAALFPCPPCACQHFHASEDFAPMVGEVEGPETCNTCNMLRLTEMLFAASPKGAYRDYQERSCTTISSAASIRTRAASSTSRWRLTFEAAPGGARLALKIRYPGCVAPDKPAARVNGSPINLTGTPGTCISIDRPADSAMN